MLQRSAVCCYWGMLFAAFRFHRSAAFVVVHKRSIIRTTLHSAASTNIADILKDKTTISVEEAIQCHGASNVKFVDGSWFLNKDRNGRQDYEKGPRIEGALYFDIDDVASKGPALNPKGLPHMMPPPKLFAAAMDAMDISNSDHLIVYGSKDCMFLHRPWWQLKSFGHEQVHLMQGSLDDWQNQGGPIQEGPTKALSSDDLDLSEPAKYTVSRDPKENLVVSLEDVKSMLKQDDAPLLVDTRSPDRFAGAVDEPRPGLRLGHIPGAVNSFFLNMIDPNNMNKLKSREELEELLKSASIDVNSEKPIVVYCGSGVTACTVAAALKECGRDFDKTLLYDGSWCEWGADSETPIVKE